MYACILRMLHVSVMNETKTEARQEQCEILQITRGIYTQGWPTLKRGEYRDGQYT